MMKHDGTREDSQFYEGHEVNENRQQVDKIFKRNSEETTLKKIDTVKFALRLK
jgi:hypothetical protein